MKMKLLISAVLVSAFMFQSCKKDNDEAPAPQILDPAAYPDYSCLRTGNYWIYQQYAIDSAGNATATNVIDSVFVEKDTLIQGVVYYKVVSPSPYGIYPGFSYLRDSLHYIVNSHGQLLFSSQDFTNHLEDDYTITNLTDTVCRMIKMMADADAAVAVPAGTFITSDARETYLMYPAYSMNGNIRYKHNRYAENVGLVVQTLPFFVGLPTQIERRLIRYHVN